jgi:molybdopterin converting factor subunit 1
MRITVRFFAVIRDRAGVSHMEMSLGDGASVGKAIDVIGGYFPQLTPLLPRIACAVNQTYVDRPTLLHDGDELALIPPVSGG